VRRVLGFAHGWCGDGKPLDGERLNTGMFDGKQGRDALDRPLETVTGEDSIVPGTVVGDAMTMGRARARADEERTVNAS